MLPAAGYPKKPSKFYIRIACKCTMRKWTNWMHIELREIQDNNYEKINLIKVLSKKKQKKREAQIKPIVYKRKILVGYPNNYKAPSILIAFLFQNFSHVQKGE